MTKLHLSFPHPVCVAVILLLSLVKRISFQNMDHSGKNLKILMDITLIPLEHEIMMTYFSSSLLYEAVIRILEKKLKLELYYFLMPREIAYF